MLDVNKKLQDIQKRLDEFQTLQNDIPTFKLKDLREKLRMYGLNDGGHKPTVTIRLENYVREQMQTLLGSVIPIKKQQLEEGKNIEISTPTKKCNKCMLTLPVSDFYTVKHADRPLAIRNRCKNCHDTRSQTYTECVDCKQPKESKESQRCPRCKACSAKRTSNRTNPNKLTKEKLEEMLLELSAKDIANLVGVSPSTIFKWKKAYNIQ